MFNLKWFCAIFLVTLFWFQVVNCISVKFKNLECKDFDKPFGDIQECRLKILGRNMVGLNLRVRLYQGPVKNITVIQMLVKV